ncbi:MAG: phosphate/phosphite/phosphonate ABC transporter substrate-binding protein [Chloroflexi bacterium]|nr:phosphate/phosphite/phosphonate ABC transporter substrate-binding protein [Chloroflexota bacterium]
MRFPWRTPDATSPPSPLRCAVLVCTLFVLAGCTMVQPRTAPLGAERNPLKLALAATIEPQRIVTTGEPLVRQLEAATGLRIKLTAPTSHAAVIEGLGTHNVDVGWLGPFAYVLARERVGAQPLLTSVRAGSRTIAGQIVVHADSGITTLEGLRRKRIAFVEPASVTGNLLPRALLLSAGLDPASAFSETPFLGTPERVVMAVYRREVESGATFGERRPGAGDDARLAVQASLPDVLTRVRVLARTTPVPNGALVARKELPAALAQTLQEGLLRIAASAEGARALRALDNIDGFAPAADADFEPVREVVARLGLNLDDLAAPGHAPSIP